MISIKPKGSFTLWLYNKYGLKKTQHVFCLHGWIEGGLCELKQYNFATKKKKTVFDSVVQRATQTSVIAIYTHFEMCMMIMIIRVVCNLMQYWISYSEKE